MRRLWKGLYWMIVLSGVLSAGSLRAKMPDTVVGESARDYRQVLFFYERYKAPGQDELVWRLPLPFYGRYRNQERAYSFHHVLYPLYFNHGTNYWRKWTMFFLFTGDDFYHGDTRKDTDLLLTPLFYWGRGDSEKERYTSFFPFFGTWKNKFSYSEINFVLFPLYVNWSYKEYKAHGLLWPLVMWGGDSLRDDLRVFPFYSRKAHRGKYARKSFLWPFFQWGSLDLDKREPRHYWYIWPFHSRKWSRDGNLSVHGILPFFMLPTLASVISAGANPLAVKIFALGLALTPIFSWGRDTRSNARNFNAFWFLYQYETNDNPYIRKHIVFPFWGYYRFAFKEFSFVTPFYYNLKTHSSIFESRTDIFGPIIPLYWKTERFYLRDWKRSHFLKMWPFFQYYKDTEGNLEFRSLVLWPARADKFERYWGPLYSLVEYRRWENGDRYFSLLFRLFSRYWNEEEERWFILGFEFHFSPRYWYVGFLGGLFGFRHDYARLPDLDLSGSPARNTAELFWIRL